FDSSGASLDPTPALIAPYGFVIDAAFNGTDFVVLWTGAGLRLTRVSPAGVVKDPTGISLPLPGGSFLYAALACSTTECLVASSASDYSSPPTPPGIFAVRMGVDGTLLDPEAFQVVANAQLVSMLKYTEAGYLMQFGSSAQFGALLALDATGHASGSP